MILRFLRAKASLPALLALGLASSAPALAEAPRSDWKVTSFTLDNGMQVVVIPDHRAPIATHMVWYKVGSADEMPGKSGIAHFFEHLMFKGTSNHKAGEFGQKIAEIGGSENAFTTYDYTAYHQTVTPAALETMMSFEADRMRNLVLTDAVIGPERDVILEERRSRVENNPGALLNEEVDATLYQNHPYRIPVIGWMHEIEKLNRVDATDFYVKYYAPNNAILIVAGDVDACDGAQGAGRKDLRQGGARTRAAAAHPPGRAGAEHQRAPSSMTDPRVSVPSYSKAWLVPSYNDGRARRGRGARPVVRDTWRRHAQPASTRALVVKARHCLVRRRLLPGHDGSMTPASPSMARRAATATLEEVEQPPSTPRSPPSSRTAFPSGRAGKGQGPGVRVDDLRPRQPGQHGQHLWQHAGDRRHGCRHRTVAGQDPHCHHRPDQGGCRQISQSRPFGCRLSAAGEISREVM
jgi:hypothetical protein